MGSAVGSLFKVTGIITYFVFGLWGFIISLSIVNAVAGFWGVVIGFFIFPITFVVAPWYALISWGTWHPLMIVYGGFIIATVLHSIGSSSFSGDQAV